MCVRGRTFWGHFGCFLSFFFGFVFSSVLSRSWGGLGLSWVALGAVLGGLGAVFGDYRQ